MLTIIDSGIANLGSVLAALHRIGAQAHVSVDPRDVSDATAIVLPGVGAFGDGMASLQRHGLVDPIRAAAAKGIPLLGICLGMQLLASASEEHGEHCGLGLIRGRVRKLPSSIGARVPNIGWYDVAARSSARLFEGIGKRSSSFYFVHSYYLNCDEESDTAATIEFGGRSVTVAVENKNIFGVQFHPEKSQDAGLAVLANFARRIATR